MNLRNWICFLLVWMGLACCCMAAELQVNDQGQAKHLRSGVTVVSGALELPSYGLWTAPDPFGLEGSITQIFLQPPQDWVEGQQSRRLMQARQEEKARMGRYPLSNMEAALMQYAQQHGKNWPPSLQDLPRGPVNPNLPVINQPSMPPFDQSPYQSELNVNAPAYALLPGKQLDLSGNPLRVDRGSIPEPLVVELLPYPDDGRHWVLFTNGTTLRVAIDAELMAQNNLKVVPLMKKPALDQPLPQTVAYEIYGLKQPGQEGSSHFRLENSKTGELLDCVWQPTGKLADPGIVRVWANQRAQSWSHLIRDHDAPVLKQWTSIHQRLYGTEKNPLPNRRQRRNADRQISAFGVLGGQAALQETFQLQGLQPDQKTGDVRLIPINQIEGVQVKSHPFKEMLTEQTGGRLPLADVVPIDHLLVHFPQPRAVQPFLEEGGDFLSYLGSMALGRSLDYDLFNRYLNRLGLTREFLDNLLQSGIVQEFAIFVPDLFLIDGSEIGIVARAPQFKELLTLLKPIGLGHLSQGNILEISTAAGSRASWSLSGDLVFISTHRSLLEHALKLHRSEGKGSLGQSDEFRYMLTQLPPTERTRGYIYFSDPFIRRLVSPATKIAQLRRLQARVNMNMATSAALLYQLDQQSAPPTVSNLKRKGYLPQDFNHEDIYLESNLVAVSRKYGSNRQLKSLTERPVTFATASEAQAYKQYVESYSRYWRQYFDPIAVRLDDAADGGLELTTFILPLLDSSMYRQIREWVQGKPGPPLNLPQIEPAPIAMLSLNLTDTVWSGLSGWLLRNTSATDTTFVDDFGPALHVAIEDGDPVLAFGGGDLMGIMGQMGGVDSVMLITSVVSLLTRPCAILIETQNPESLRQLLEKNGLASLFTGLNNNIQVETYRITDRDAWVLCVDLLSMARLRFGVEVQDNFIVITNQPWSHRVAVQNTVASKLSDASLHLEPAAARKQLAAMFTSAAESQRRSALQGNAILAPLVWTDAGDASDAISQHRQLFGFAPEHPSPGNWVLDTHGSVMSSDYGSSTLPQQPGYEEGQPDFGLLKGISPVNVSLQIEDTGLRARIYWKYAEPSAVPDSSAGGGE